MNTSTQAYTEGLEDGSISRLNKRIEHAFTILICATTGEVSRFLGLSQETTHKRISDAKNKGLIRPSGDTRRDIETKRSQTVWELIQNISEGS